MAISPAFLILLSLIGCSASKGVAQEEAPPPPRGCGSSVAPAYRVLCDLESVWGVVLEAVACGGVVTSIILATLLLAKLKTVTEQERRCGVGPLLLLLLGIVCLFGLSPAFLVGRGEVLCVARRSLFGSLFAMCFSCLLVQGVRLRRLAAGKRSPSGSSLSLLALGLTSVQGMLAGEWLLLTVAREGRTACDYLPVDFALAGSYALGLLLAATALSLCVVLCGGRGGEEASKRQRGKWRCNAVWLFLACLASLLLWAGWLAFYLYGNAASAPRASRLRGSASASVTGATDWDEPALALALVTVGWSLLLFYAIPETHLCLRQPANQRSDEAGQDSYYDARQLPTTSSYHDDEAPAANHRSGYAERQAFTVEEQHTAAVQAGGYHAGVIRPVLPFRSHVYQPTEMAVLMNGGAIPTAPPNYTGRHLW